MVLISFLSFPVLLTFLSVTLVLAVSLSSGLITYAVLNFFGMNKELIYGKSNFAQQGVIVASNNIKTHKKLCLEIKETIKKYNLFTSLEGLLE